MIVLIVLLISECSVLESALGECFTLFILYSLSDSKISKI